MVEIIRLMEVLLNAIWLLVAAGAFLFWRPAKFKGTPTDRGHGRSFGIVALACALVLLFPVISLTDDLHAEQVAMEDSSRSVMKARNMVHGCLRAGSFFFVAAVINAPSSAAALHLFSGLVVPVETRLLRLTLISAHKGRSPPSNV
ncbi:MAG TPA: hypothetical protein VKO18_14150 [Terriglobia bacterium]|nr:hypothetical protein [Terriglobia bacterium]